MDADTGDYGSFFSADVIFFVFLSLAASSLLVSLYFFLTDQSAVYPFTVPIPENCSPTWQGNVLDQPQLKVKGSSAIQCYNPANGQSLGIVNAVTSTGIDRAVARAKEAQSGWRTSTWAQRRQWLRSLKKHILDNQETIVTAACLDSGKTRVDAYFGEVLVTLEKIDWVTKHGEASLKSEKRPTNLLMCYKTNEVRWEPKGVVAACVSWNYPFHNLLSPIISSIFAGNAIVLKPSERTAWSSQYFVAIARESLVACGHSANLIQSCICWPSVAPYLVAHPTITHLTFIGSREVAHHVARAASESLTELCLELGGKDAAIILDDVADSKAELDRVAAILVRGVFQAAGQNCIGIERIIAQEQVYSHLVRKLEPLVRALRCGNPLAASDRSSALNPNQVVDVGAMISSDRFSELEALISEAVAGGARLLVGGRRLSNPSYPQGSYFQPTLLIDVTPSMRIAQVELFAPVMVLMRAPSADVDAAIDLANSTAYSLGASVFGRDSAAIERVVQRMRAGMVAVNDFAAYYAVQLPFGGVGGSGYGRFAGKEGLRSVCDMKSVCRDRWSGLAKTAIPPALQIPYGGVAAGANRLAQVSAVRRAEETVRGVVELGYGDNLRRRVGGLRRILGI